MNILGPSSEPLRLDPSLLDFIMKCTSYVGRLSLFDQYCIWRYTIGSASINTFLITTNVSPNAPFWTSLFFRYWHNSTKNPISGIPYDFRKFLAYFNNPALFNALSKSDQSIVSAQIIFAYIHRMVGIVRKAPRVAGQGFHVYKVASKYPGLPDNITNLPADVVQLPFNSTTINPHFNFEIFTNPGSNCCLFDIFVPPGSMCLWVPEYLHAYPFEKEIILPPGSVFGITSITNGIMNYIEKNKQNIQVIQDPKNIRIGNVYDISTYEPCIDNVGKPAACMIQSKSFIIYNTILKYITR